MKGKEVMNIFWKLKKHPKNCTRKTRGAKTLRARRVSSSKSKVKNTHTYIPVSADELVINILGTVGSTISIFKQQFLSSHTLELFLGPATLEKALFNKFDRFCDKEIFLCVESEGETRTICFWFDFFSLFTNITGNRIFWEEFMTFLSTCESPIN